VVATAVEVGGGVSPAFATVPSRSCKIGPSKPAHSGPSGQPSSCTHQAGGLDLFATDRLMCKLSRLSVILAVHHRTLEVLPCWSLG